ncbi:hypothetical protein VTI74DRAFT_9621 [Chaetomium olivicolor]
MLTDNPVPSSPPLELRPPPHSVPAHPPQVAIPDNGYVSPRQQFDRRTPTGSPFQLTQKQPHVLNLPRPSLSPLSEYHSGFSNEDIASSPCASPSPSSLAIHRRQHSFPNLLPLAFRSRTPSPVRKTHTRSPSEQMPYTGDPRSGGKAAGAGGLMSWLSGSAGAANALGLSHHAESRGTIGTPSKDALATIPDTTPTRLRRNTAADLTTPKSSTTATMTTASRFMSALFNPTTTTTTTTSNSTPTTPNLSFDPATDDDLFHLDIHTALFPASPTSPSLSRDAFSPSAFKNLQQNALGLLAKMQAAYRKQALALRDARAEQAAQQDELEEAQLRVRHLKAQLEGMASQAQECEERVRALVEELEHERGKRGRLAEELEAERARRVRAERLSAVSGSSGVVGAEEGASMVSEDLGVDDDYGKRRRRRSRGNRKSWKSGSGMTFEEDEEEEETDEEIESVESESVFSRCRSPALPQQPPQAHTGSDGASVMGVIMDGAGTPHVKQGGSVNATPKKKGGQQMTAFQKILKGISRDTGGEGVEGDGCANCKGRDASVAWDTVGLLRDENTQLKRRVGELEVAVEGALDLVKGVGL